MMLKKCYQLIASFYCYITSKYENLAFKENYKINNSSMYFNKINQLKSLGYSLVKFQNNLINSELSGDILKVNKYMEKLILEENQIKKIIADIFIRNKLDQLISQLTGFSFSIDYMIVYNTFGMTSEEKNKEWYANKWHIDRPFSRNTLKIIIPVNNIRESDGGIEILDKKLSQGLNNKIKNVKNYFKMCSDKNELLIFSPNLCYHRAGIPNVNNSRSQIMMQLNPSKKWEVNSKIKDYQKRIEPKFPIFSYFLNKKEQLKNFCRDH